MKFLSYFKLPKTLIYLSALASVASFNLSAEAPKLTSEQIKQKVANYNYILGTQAIGGHYQFSKDNLLVEQAKQIKGLGFNLLKISIGRGTAKKYGFERKANRAQSVLELVETVPAYQKIFDMNFKYYQAWVHSLTDANWHNGVSKEEAKVYYQEMYELAEYLLTRYSGTGKVFMLGNWEGDWLLQGIGNRNAVPNNSAINGMTDWLNVRQQAIDDAKKNIKHTDVELYHYVEVNLAKKAMKGEASVAHSVLPNTDVDLVSYSSYEAIKDSKEPSIDSIRKPLTNIMNYLEKQLKPKAGLPFNRRVFIGEYGYHANKKKPELVKHQFLKSKYVAQVAVELDLPFALIWQMYNNEYHPNGESKEMSLIDESGEKRLLYYLHKVFYQNMKYFVSQSYKRTGQAPSDEAFKAKAIKVLENLSMEKVSAAKKKIEKLQNEKRQKAKNKP